MIVTDENNFCKYILYGHFKLIAHRIFIFILFILFIYLFIIIFFYVVMLILMYYYYYHGI